MTNPLQRNLKGIFFIIFDIEIFGKHLFSFVNAYKRKSSA
jgi:hypothetical protein